eukprot:6007542-Prymnesium_polylepis.1
MPLVAMISSAIYALLILVLPFGLISFTGEGHAISAEIGASSLTSRFAKTMGDIYTTGIFHLPAFVVGCCAGRHVLLIPRPTAPQPGQLCRADALLFLLLAYVLLTCAMNWADYRFVDDVGLQVLPSSNSLCMSPHCADEIPLVVCHP